MPARSSIFNWLRDHRDFADQYALAKQFQIYDLYDKILDAARSCDRARESTKNEGGFYGNKTGRSVTARHGSLGPRT